MTAKDKIFMIGSLFAALGLLSVCVYTLDKIESEKHQDEVQLQHAMERVADACERLPQ